MNLIRYRTSKGFTLIELIAVLAILALVVGIAAPAIFKQIAKGKKESAKVEIGSLESALNGFYIDCGFFPSTEQGLDALINPPTIGTQCKNYDPDGYLKKKKIPLDPFDEPYQYVSPGEHQKSAFDLSSKGADRQPGTEDDVNNWE